MTETKRIRSEPCLPTSLSAGSLNQGCACSFLDVPHLHHQLEVDSNLAGLAGNIMHTPKPALGYYRVHHSRAT